VKAEELRALDVAELEDRLKGARRELYELRFKLAVGQLENHRQIRRTRKDIARILTVLHQRRLESSLEDAAVPAAVAASSAAEVSAPVQETPEHVEAPRPGEPGATPPRDQGSGDPGGPGTDREEDDD